MDYTLNRIIKFNNYLFFNYINLMRHRHCIKEHSRFTPNTYKYLETDAEKIIEETRKNLDKFLNNLREHASIKDSFNFFSKEEKKPSSNTKRQKIYYQKEIATFNTNKTNGNRNYNIPIINLPETITNTCHSCSGPRQSVQSELKSEKKLYSISKKDNDKKNVLNLKLMIDEKTINKIKSNIQFIQKSNNENKKEILNLANLQNRSMKELLSKVNDYIFNYIQKENELTKYINELKTQEQNEIQKYKQHIDNLSQVKNKLMKECSSLSLENKDKTNEIERFKQELENFRNENSEKENELQSAKTEIEKYQIKCDKLLKEKINLQLKLKEFKNTKSQLQQQYPKFFNNNLLKNEISHRLNYNPKKKLTPFKIENTINSVMYHAVIKPKNVFQIVKSFQQILQYNKKTFNNNQQIILSKINTLNYIQPSKHKSLTSVSPEITLSINSVSKPQQGEDKEKIDLKNQLQYVTQKYKSLLKNQTSEKKMVNKEKEKPSDLNNDLILKEQEIKQLKLELEKVTNELTILKNEMDIKPILSQNTLNNSGKDDKFCETKVLKDLEESNQEKENIKKENRQLQHKLQDIQTEIKKYREQIKALTTDKVKFEIKETTLNNQMESLYDEIESLKEELESKEEEEKNKKKKLKQLIDKGLDEGESIESLREKVTMLRLELNENHENINKAREVLQKAKSFDECSKSMDIVLKDYSPKNEEQINAMKLLKIIFGFKAIKLASPSEQLSEDTNQIEPLQQCSNTNERVEVGRGSSLKQKGYLKELLKNKENKD